MKNKKLYLLSIMAVLSGLLITQCKKYPDADVFIQWKKPEKRLIKCGPWVFDKLTVDGVDKSAEFRADSAYFTKIEFHKKADNGDLLMTIYGINGYEFAYGRYKFLENKNTLSLVAYSIYISELSSYGPVFRFEFIDWEILRLSKKGMTLKTTYNSSEYVLSLASQD